jgi:RNA-splicing ligase RtcB
MAVATRNTLRPQLTDAALNCGMAMAVLDVDRPTDSAVENFYRRVRERFAAKWRRDLTREEVIDAAVEGADFAAERFDIPTQDLQRVEEFGRLDIEEYGGKERARKELPWLVTQLARLRFGAIGPSTHFLELQQVEEIYDQRLADLLGLQIGQVTLQLHNGGGVLTSQLGELYGRRKAASRQLRTEMSVQKPLTHLVRAGSLATARRRLAAYFSTTGTVVDAGEPEGLRLQLAQRLAMNYGFAYRLATIAALRSFAEQELAAGMRLVVDSPHNSVYPEIVDGERAFVHRHNACRAYPADMMRSHPAFAETGQPLLLPGTNQTSSYLCVPGPEAKQSLYTACHGTGSIIDAFARSGRSVVDPFGRQTLKFGYSDEAPRVVPHLDDAGVDAALSILTRHQLVRPVVRLRPFAVLT